MAVTVGNVTVIITDYKLLEPEQSPLGSPERNSPVPPMELNSTDNQLPSISNNESILSDGGSREEDST